MIRSFLLCACAVVLVAGAARPQHSGPGARTAPPDSAADELFIHGRIYTADTTHPWAEAVAIRDSLIQGVGTTAEVRRYAGPRTRVIDLRGRLAVPGLIDTHTHFIWGSHGLAGVDVGQARSVVEVRRRVRAFARKHRGASWIYGSGWDYGSFWPTGLPTREMLDAAVPDRPAALLSSDCHSLWVNSKALAAAGITRSTPDPNTPTVRGIIVRDRVTGEPTGVLEEGAKSLVLDVLPVTREQRLGWIRLGMAYANRHGVTSVINASGDIPEMELYQTLRDRGELTIRTTTAMMADVGMRHVGSPEELSGFEEARRRFHSDWVRAGLIKVFADGVIESHTAAMLAPYANSPDNSGTPIYSPEELRHILTELDRRGFQVMTHAIGDGAVRMVLDAYDSVAARNGARDRRWRIEHMETVDPADRPRPGTLDVLASVQPWCCPHAGEPWGDNVGPGRMSEGLPYGEIAAHGARIIMGSDWPVQPIDPFPIIQQGVTRQGLDGTPPDRFFPDQALTVDQMMAGYTRQAAFAAFMEDRVGTLAPGKLADLAVLSQNVFTVAPRFIAKTKVVLTMVGGRVVWNKVTR